MLCRAPGDERLDSFETCRADKKLWNKTDYKNCASRWLLTHCNMMHGTYNVKTIDSIALTEYNITNGTQMITQDLNDLRL